MYLLEGAGELHRQFRMVVGDVMVFAQKADRTLVVAGRPATKVGRGQRRWWSVWDALHLAEWRWNGGLVEVKRD